MTDRPGFPGISSLDAAKPFMVATIINNILEGKINVVVDATITEADGAPVTIADPRFHDQSYVGVMNFSATPLFFISDTREGEIDISWTGAGWTSRVIRLLVIG